MLTKYYRLLAALISLVLLVAAFFKAHQLITKPAVASDIFTSPWVVLAAIVLELTLALWLLAGFHAALCKCVTFVVFSIFLGISLIRAVTNEASCGCFGSLTVKPWQIAILDVIILIALALAQPTRQCFARFSVARMFALALIPLAGGAAGGFSILVNNGPGLVPSSNPINFGIVPPGEIREQSIWLHNATPSPITIAEFSSSCPCVSVHLDQSTISARENIRAYIRMDTRLEPHFTGNLRVEIRGRMANGKEAVSFLARAKIGRD